MIENIVEYLKSLTPRDIKPDVITSLPFPDSYSILEILHAIGEKLDYIINQGGGGGGSSDDLWRPTVSAEGIISWRKSTSTTTPTPQNIKGPKGTDGTNGTDGVSPTASVVQTETGATVTVTDASGTTTATLTNGKNGTDGSDGAPGKDGVSPTAKVEQTETGATVTVTDASGTTTATLTNGKNGTNGTDGVSPTAKVEQTETGATVTVTDASGTTTATLTNGKNGTNGTDGAPGKDGTTPTFEVGSVTKLAPDADPTVTLEDVGGGLYMIDYGIPQGQPGTPGTGSGDVVAAGNNVFTGTNHFEGLTVLGETHAETPTDDNDVTNKLYVDTVAGNMKTSAVEEADGHTDTKLSALRTLPAGGTSGQVPTIASNGSTVEWQTPSGGGGGDTPKVYKQSSATCTGSGISTNQVTAQVYSVGKMLYLRGFINLSPTGSTAQVSAIDIKFSESVPTIPSVSSGNWFRYVGKYMSFSQSYNNYDMEISRFGNEYLLNFGRGTSTNNLTVTSDGEQGYFEVAVVLD